MLIIVEGPNGAGKTTLVHRLIDEIKLRDPEGEVVWYHRGPPTSHPLDEYERPLFTYRPGRHEHVICERWHLGEAVYPHVLGRPTQLTTSVRRHIDLFLRSRGAVLVHVTQDDDVIVRQFTQRDRVHSQVTADMLPTIAAGFRSAYRFSCLWKQEVRDVLAESVARELVHAAWNADEIARGLNPFVTYVGPRWPRYLLLGDVRNGSFGASIEPAFGPYPGTSGDFLLRHLPSFFEMDVGIANACDVDDPLVLRETLGRPPTVALGRRAQRHVEVVSTVPHPQYVRRFFHRRGGEYGQLIIDAARGVLREEEAVWWRH